MIKSASEHTFPSDLHGMKPRFCFSWLIAFAAIFYNFLSFEGFRWTASYALHEMRAQTSSRALRDSKSVRNQFDCKLSTSRHVNNWGTLNLITVFVSEASATGFLSVSSCRHYSFARDSRNKNERRKKVFLWPDSTHRIWCSKTVWQDSCSHDITKRSKTFSQNGQNFLSIRFRQSAIRAVDIEQAHIFVSIDKTTFDSVRLDLLPWAK